MLNKKEINAAQWFIKFKNPLLLWLHSFIIYYLQHFPFATGSKLPSLFGIPSKDMQEKRTDNTDTLK